MVRSIVVLGGTSHPQLTLRICRYLGIKQSDTHLGKFSSGETRVEINASVRGKDVFIIQSSKDDVNDSLLELLITISACKIASAKRIVIVTPFFPYSKQKDSPYEGTDGPLLRARHDTGKFIESSSKSPRAGLSEFNKDVGSNNVVTGDYQSDNTQWFAKPGTLVANLLTCAGADHIVTMDLHNAQYQGFFNIPVDNIYARPLLKAYIREQIPNHRDVVIVSPDAGGAKRATLIADELGLDFALIHKVVSRTKYEGTAPLSILGSSTSVNDSPATDMILVGDVDMRTVVLVDDLVDTCSTLTSAARLLKTQGASTVHAIVTHGILSGDAIRLINDCDALDRLVVTDTVPQDQNCQQCGKIVVLGADRLLAEASQLYLISEICKDASNKLVSDLRNRLSEGFTTARV